MIWPLKEIHVNQLFGNPNDIYKPLGFTKHNGIDLMAPTGTPVFASHDGTALYQIDNSGGHGVVIQSLDTINGKYYKTIYWHLIDSTKFPQFKSPIEDNPKDVKQGELIGYANNTGFSTGPHLHFGMKYVDPYGETINKDNGYSGAIDPLPHLPPVGDFNYTFTKGLTKGSLFNNITEVKALQKSLNIAMKRSIPITGYYGAITASALLDFQLMYNVADKKELLDLQGKVVGPATRATLNRFFSR